MSQSGSRPLLSFRIGDQPVPGYRLVRELGRGTFGVVWLAVTDNGFERALKVVNLEQRGGKKEFRALRLIKDRKILHGNLLMLVDYWLLDREGTILNTANDPTLESQIAPGKSSGSGGAGQKVKTDQGAQVQVTNVALRKGTMMPVDGEDSGPLSVRDTFAQNRMTDTREDESNAAIWLIVAMELGHKTLHDRQKEHTVEERGKHPSKVNRKRATQFDRKVDTSPGSNTVEEENQRRQDEEEDEELFPLPADEVLPYMEQAARGLDHLHRNEIVHRDVKPQNIMLVGDVAKVCDYGLASELNDIRATTNAFTLPYAASEAINKRPTPASDQYSLAVTYVELRTGRWPFPSNTQTAVFACKDSGVHDLKFIRKRAVRLVLKKALAKNPKDRYATCGDFVRELAVAENSKSSMFALAQVVLAALAIVTVLMAAAATHPGVRATVIDMFDDDSPVANGGAGGQTALFDLDGYKKDLIAADALLKDEQKLAQAQSKYGDLYKRRNGLTEENKAIHVDVLEGLGRAKLGVSGIDAEKGPSDELRQAINGLLTDIEQLNYPALSQQQLLRQQYLVQCTNRDGANPQYDFKPDSTLAKQSLETWELELWKKLIKPKTDSQKLLDTVIAHRKLHTPTGFESARSVHNELVEKAQLEKLPLSFQHQIDLEDIHLNHLAGSKTPEENLQQLQALIANLEATNIQLVSRANLLKLLILQKQQPELHLFDEKVYPVVANSQPDIYTKEEALNLDFSEMDSAAIQELRDRFEQDILGRDKPIAGNDPQLLSAVSKVFDRRKCLKVLMDRVELRLKPGKLTAMQLLGISNDWADLQAYLRLEYAEKKPDRDDEKKLADLAIRAALINAEADPEKSLAGFAQHFRKASRDSQAEALERLLVQGESLPSWTFAALVPLRDLLKDPPEALQEDPSQLDDWRQRVTVLEFREVLKIDPANTANLRGKLADLSRGPLPEALRVELEMVETKDHSPAALKMWQERVEKAIDAGDWKDPEHRHYIYLLLARLQSTRDGSLSESSEESLRELFSQKERPYWFTDWRRQGAEGVFAQLAMRDLRSTGKAGSRFDDSLVLQFADIGPVEMPRLAALRSQAEMLGLNINLLEVVDALRQATDRKNVDWAKINNTLKSRDPALDVFFDQQNCGRLLRYVTALSALESLPPGSTFPDESILGFDQLLHQAISPARPYFVYEEKPSSQDVGALKNLVNKLLQHTALTDADAQGKSPDVKQALARLWAAKGRILQRSPNSVIVDETRQMNTRDFLLASNLLSSEAYLKARALHDDLKYVIGYGRTLRYLPTSMLKGSDLPELMQKYNPKGDQPDPGMQYLYGYHLYLQAFREPDSSKRAELFKQIIGRFTTLVSLVGDDDPWQLAELCQESLSDSHLNLAFLTPVKSAEEARALERDQRPPDDSKAHHLSLAAKHADLHAKLRKELVQRPEKAAIELGNAYEDYSYYLHLTDYYPRSVEQFREALKILRADGRDGADAQYNYGRCLYRYATEPHPPTGVAYDRVELLTTAIGHLEDAVKSETLTLARQAESRYWLAQNQKALFGHRAKIPEYVDKPESAFALLQQAAKNLGGAAAKAADDKQPLDQFMFMSFQLETLMQLKFGWTKATTAEKQALGDQIGKVENDAFAMFRELGQSLRPSNAGIFARNAGYRWSAAKKDWERDSVALNRWLDVQNDQRAWKSSELWKLEEFLVRLSRANQFEKSFAESELVAAQTIQKTMDEKYRLIAQAHLDDVAAQRAVKSIAALDGKPASVMLAEYSKQIPLLIKAAQTRSKILEGDEIRGPLFEKIRLTKLSDLEALGRELSSFEKRKLLDELQRHSLPKATWNIGMNCLIAFELERLDTNNRIDLIGQYSLKDLARAAHGTLKPFYVLPTGDADVSRAFSRVSALEDYLKN